MISPKGLRSHMEKLPGALSKPQKALMKNREIYLIPKSTATLTQSGLLAMLLQRHRALCSIFGATAVELVAAKFYYSNSAI